MVIKNFQTMKSIYKYTFCLKIKSFLTYGFMFFTKFLLTVFKSLLFLILSEVGFYCIFCSFGTQSALINKMLLNFPE